MRKSIFVLTALVAIGLFGCKERAYIDAPGDNAHNLDSIPEAKDPEPSPDPEGLEIPEGTINVNEAVNIGKKLQVSTKDDKHPTDKAYYIKGWVSRFDDKERGKADFEDKFAQYGNDYVYLSARADGEGKKEFYCYRILGQGGAKLPNHDVLQIGDFVVVKCNILNFNNIIESDGTCSIELSNNPLYNEAFQPVQTIKITCAEAKTIVASMEDNATTNDTYIVDGYVQKDGYDATISRGQQKFIWLDDVQSGKKVVQGYWCNVPDGKTAIPVGTKIRITGKITKYNGNPEIKNGDIEILE